MRIVIREANPKDVPNLIKHFSHYKAPEFIKQRVLAHLAFGKTIIADREGNIAGILQWVCKENPQTGVAEFEEVFVIETERNQGIGFELVSEGIRSVRAFFKQQNIKPRKIFLFVSKGNTEAIRLYQKLGFKYESEVKGLFADHLNELIYILDLQ